GKVKLAEPLFSCVIFPIPLQQQQEEIATKKLRLTKPSKSAALHIDLCKATSPADALQYLLQFARKPVEAESVEGVVRILLEHYYKGCTSWDSPNTPSASPLLR
uniref:Integrator complex subunit 4 n=2 Tax=Canis lupus familiaris TaxID=9615 RepID=A0A8I3N4X5_CANLF